MIRFNNVAELEAALRAAEKAHHTAELSGESTAEHWPAFYAAYLMGWCMSGEYTRGENAKILA